MDETWRREPEQRRGDGNLCTGDLGCWPQRDRDSLHNPVQFSSVKIEGPQILSNLRATSDIGPISRILYGIAAVTVIPLGRSSLKGSSDLPGSLAHRADTHGFFSRTPQRLTPASPSRPVRAERLSPLAHPRVTISPL